MMKKENYEIGEWVKELIKKEKPCFYEVDENKKTCYDLKTKKTSLDTNEPQLIKLNSGRKKTIINTQKINLDKSYVEQLQSSVIKEFKIVIFKPLVKELCRYL